MSATITAIVDLRKKQLWDPGVLAAATFRWPVRWSLQRLDDIGTQIEPQLFVEQGTQVITPDGLDRVHGDLRRRTTKYQGSGYLVGGDASNLQPGDLLIPARADIPALVVHADLAGSTVSAGFSVYRFSSMEDAHWVWAVLSSTAGRSFRSAFTLGSLSTKRARIGDTPLPWPDDDVRARMSGAIAEIESQARREEEEGVATWWTTTDLRQVAWQTALVAPKPERILDGVPIEQLSNEIRVGKQFDRIELQAAPAEGLLPVVTGAALAGRTIVRWLADTPDASVAEPGDVLVAAVGERANARIAEQRAVIDSGVYRIRLKEPRQAGHIVAFLNGQNGYALRKLRLSGTTIPRLSRRDLAQLRVPEAVLAAEEADGPVEPLAEQLERVLWAN